MAVKKLEKGEVERIILGSIGLVGLVSISLVAPNALQLLKVFRKKHARYQSPAYVASIVKRLEKKGWVERTKEHGRVFVQVTPKGELELLKSKQQQMIKKPKWDGKWRVVIFDIKESRRSTRGKIRQDIMEFGFERLQNSVWVYPYDCEDLIALLKVSCHIGKEVLYIVSEKIENDGWLRKKFGLL